MGIGAPSILQCQFIARINHSYSTFGGFGPREHRRAGSPSEHVASSCFAAFILFTIRLFIILASIVDTNAARLLVILLVGVRETLPPKSLTHRSITFAVDRTRIPRDPRRKAKNSSSASERAVRREICRFSSLSLCVVSTVTSVFAKTKLHTSSRSLHRVSDHDIEVCE